MNCNVRDFGAAGDGEKPDQCHIQAAIDFCSLNGGGTVNVPAGNYLCATIVLKSDVRLYLDMGAVIKAAEAEELYPVICPTPYGNLPGQIQALIWAEDAENIVIDGYGHIDGGKDEPLSPQDSVNRKFRPALVFIRNCRKVQICGVTMKNASFWTLHMLKCDGVIIKGISIFNNRDRINTDGIDPDGCRNMIISGCFIETGDDCIVVKSTEGDPCENIVVSDCVLSTSQAALKIGTEAVGDIKRITFSNCIIHRSLMAAALYMKDGSVYEDIIFNNITAEAYGAFPIFVDITPRYLKSEKAGEISGVLFNNIMVTSNGRCYAEGFKDMRISGLVFNNISWRIREACSFENMSKPPGARRVEIDCSRTNYAVLPYQFIGVNIDGLELKGFSIKTGSGKLSDRGVLYLENVAELAADMLCHPEVSDGIETFVFKDCQKMLKR